VASARLLLLVAILALAFPAHAAEHVIQISVDGLSGILLQGLVQNDAAGDFAHFERFVAEGATTFNARADYTYTITLPNHTTMLTGRPVTQPAGQPNTVHHGWTSNNDPAPGVAPHNGGNPNLSYIASSYDVAHGAGRSTALFASKTKFVLFERSYPALIDVYVNASAASMHQSLLAALAANHFDYAFVHYSLPDDAGHASGWGSPQWNDAVRSVDDMLASLFALIDSDPELHGRTLVILSADHGGAGTGHSDATNPANYTIPFFLWGEGVQPGANLYAVNAGRRADPGTGRPSYTAAVQPIRNGDGANLALAALGLAPVPGSSINAAQDLLTAVPAVCGDGTVSPGEQCDDGNTASGDCCSPTCQYDVAGSACDLTNVCATSACNGSGVCVAGPPTVPLPAQCPQRIPLFPSTAP
jgi:cysteine-rich repeat protein